jgi:arabinan endo-1,5-alpha-L-arabinosidase
MRLRSKVMAAAAVLGALAAGAVAVRAPVANAATYPNPGLVTGDITAVHDPSMLKTPSGTYILVSTDQYLQIRTSTDRINFTRVGSVWPNGAPWTAPFTSPSNPGYLWAPDISYHNGKYYLYYSASTLGSRNSAIFLATSPTAMPGTWTNLGIVVQTSSANNYNAIDPNLFVDSAGRWWLSFGSWGTGIKMIRLDPATGKRSSADTTLYGIARRSGSTTAEEAPYIVQHGSFYYLYVSWDLCCQGTRSTYRIMVGRSTSITGPYTDRNGTAMNSSGGTEILAAHGTIYGPGHEAIMHDTDADVLIYHYYYSDSTPLTGKLGINLIGYDSANWPYVY